MRDENILLFYVLFLFIYTEEDYMNSKKLQKKAFRLNFRPLIYSLAVAFTKFSKHQCPFRINFLLFINAMAFEMFPLINLPKKKTKNAFRLVLQK